MIPRAFFSMFKDYWVGNIRPFNLRKGVCSYWPTTCRSDTPLWKYKQYGWNRHSSFSYYKIKSSSSLCRAVKISRGWYTAHLSYYYWIFFYCVNNVITPISLPLFSSVRSTVPLSRNRGSTSRTIGGKYKDKVLYRGIGGVQEEYKEAYNNGEIFLIGRIFYNVYK